MDVNVRRAIGVFLFFVSTPLFGCIAYALLNYQDFHRLFTCFTFGTLGLALRAIFYGEAKSENALSYGYYFLALVVVSSSIFVGFYDTFDKLSGPFFYFLAFALFTSAGFIVRTILNGLIG